MATDIVSCDGVLELGTIVEGSDIGVAGRVWLRSVTNRFLSLPVWEKIKGWS